MESKGGSNGSTTDELHVVMFPYLAFGHIVPFIHLSNKLCSHGVRVSFVSAPAAVPRIASSLHPTIQIIPLQGLPPHLQNTSDLTPAMAELLKHALDQMQPQIKTLLSTLKPHLIFFDFAQHWLPSLASALSIKTVHFSVFSALSAAFMTVPARRAASASADDLKNPPPGFPTTAVTALRTFEAKDFSYIFKSFNGDPCVYDRVLAGFHSCDVVAFKTCMEMEAPYVEFVKTQFGKPVLLAGPLAPEPPSGQLDDKWAKWLGKFPAKSVIFCSFGSETFLTDDQIKELVLGLELTGLPFFLVLNFPAGAGEDRVAKALPDGVMERVKERGVVHSGWVQQQHILAHVGVGCYVCHAGFSSVMEAMVNDCQLVMMAQKGDQFMNSKLVSMDMKAGVEVRRREEDGHFGKEDILGAIMEVMVEADKEPGKSIRANHKKWREFLINREVQSKYVSDFVQDMKALVNI
ncbi:anthocyanidin-3-O-glucoside rhamnosyltransferase-like [Malania oleifera]|uniref:anthocyanidin-3-O-glucoside rhamnosyltransferase-like n=1 Tax=Malania oleifera TaxID=397392 RepID=UPI0025ADB210|nr:anthocyanidin-3-O-glucoside rhamnosyltransferase-like [Malania oleifera]